MKDTTLHFPVKCRTRVRPPLPHNYVGNAAVMTSVNLSSSTLLHYHTSTLADLAFAIREAEASINVDYVDAVIRFANTVPDLAQLADMRAHTYARAFKVFGDAARPADKFDGGPSLNKAVIRHPHDIFTDGRAQILPPLENGDLEVAIGLTKSGMQRLKRDGVFGPHAIASGGANEPDGFRTTVYTPSDLSKPLFASQLSSITAMINEAFRETHKPFLTGGGRPRFSKPSTLINSLGSTGFLAVTIDPRNGGVPIAAVGAKPWKGRMPRSDRDSTTEKIVYWQSEADEWEITAVAVRQDPKYQKRALCSALLRCVDEELLRQSRSEDQKGVAGDSYVKGC